MTAVVKEQFRRVLGRSTRIFGRSRHLKPALLGGLLLLIGLLAAFSDHSPNLAHVRVGVLSGDPQQNYSGS